MRISALDIGSNSIKLLVVDAGEDGSLRRIFDEAPVTRLSEGLDASGELNDVAMARTIDGIADLLRRAGIDSALGLPAIVTAPGRRSSNGEDFVRQLDDRLGVIAEIATPEREAALSLLATQRAFPTIDPFVMIDLGGASTELVLCQAGKNAIALSVDIGAVRLTEARLSGDPPSPTAIRLAEDAARAQFESIAEPFRQENAPLLLVSGTATTLACLHLELNDYLPERVHGTRLSRPELERLVDRLAPMTVAEKRLLSGMNPARADVILGGLLLVLAVFDALASDVAVVSDRGARWGLIWEQVDSLGIGA